MRVVVLLVAMLQVMGLPTPDVPPMVKIPKPGIKLEESQVLSVSSVQEPQILTNDLENAKELAPVESTFSEKAEDSGKPLLKQAAADSATVMSQDAAPTRAVKSNVPPMGDTSPFSQVEVAVPTMGDAAPVSLVEVAAPTMGDAAPVSLVEVAVPALQADISVVPVVKPALPTPVLEISSPIISPMNIVKAAVPALSPVEPSSVLVSIVPEPLLAPEPPMPSIDVPFAGGKLHVQDETGQYTFSHWGGPNTRVEMKNSLGITSGSFAYINPGGEVHVRKYAAGPFHGFRVAASDLPINTNLAVQDTPEVAKVKAAHAELHAAVISEAQAKA